MHESDSHYRAVRRRFWRHVYAVKAVVWLIVVIALYIAVRRNF